MLPDALVLAPRGMYVEDATLKVDEFTFPLTERTCLLFRRMATAPTCFEVAGVLCASSQGQHPIASVRGVLWSRRAAPEADRGIASFRAQESYFGPPPTQQTEVA
jgi:hypothetical protein